LIGFLDFTIESLVC